MLQAFFASFGLLQGQFNARPASIRVLHLDGLLPSIEACPVAFWAMLRPAVATHGWVKVPLTEFKASCSASAQRARCFRLCFDLLASRERDSTGTAAAVLAFFNGGDGFQRSSISSL